MLTYFIKRMGSSVFLMFIVSFVSFSVLMILPGDPVQLMLGMDAPPKAAAVLRAQLGLDKPWYIQYTHWLIGLLQGDLGQSFIYQQSVQSLIVQRLPLTISITLFSLMISLAISLPLGIVSAIKRGKWIDRIIQVFVQIGLAIPNFWIAILLILLFSVYLSLFAPSGYVPLSKGILPHLKSILMPSLSLAFVEAAAMIRMLRASLIDVIDEDYMIFAQTSGVASMPTHIYYAMRNSLVGPLTLLGFQVMGLLSGVVIIENIFALPGIGRLLLIAVEKRDLILVQGLIIFITFSVIMINLIIDILYRVIDPRVQLEKGVEKTA